MRSSRLGHVQGWMHPRVCYCSEQQACKLSLLCISLTPASSPCLSPWLFSAGLRATGMLAQGLEKSPFPPPRERSLPALQVSKYLFEGTVFNGPTEEHKTRH